MGVHTVLPDQPMLIMVYPRAVILNSNYLQNQMPPTGLNANWHPRHTNHITLQLEPILILINPLSVTLN